MKKSYQVLTRIEHDNKPYEIGAQIELDDDAAKVLIDVKAIDGDSATDVAPGAPTDPEIRHSEICEAIGMLDPSNEELWNAKGKPDAAAISVITGWNVTAKERDAAWAEVKPA